MKLTQHGENLFQLTFLGVVNCYLVRETDGLTLIDALIAGRGQGILAAAAELGQPIRRVLLTHAHTDHVGALDEMAAALPEAEFLFTVRTEQFLQGAVRLEAGEPDAPIKGGFVRRQTAATAYLLPDQPVGSLLPIATPGHSPDHTAFLDTRDCSLIAGDAFQTKAGTAVSGTLRLLFPFPALATWHKPTALASAQKLADVAPSRLAVGHGPVLEKPLPAMLKAIAKAQQGVQLAYG